MAVLTIDGVLEKATIHRKNRDGSDREYPNCFATLVQGAETVYIDCREEDVPVLEKQVGEEVELAVQPRPYVGKNGAMCGFRLVRQPK